MKHNIGRRQKGIGGKVVMSSQIERLAKDMYEYDPGLNWDNCMIRFPWMDKAKTAIDKGWIHKAEAVNWVEVCPRCHGADMTEYCPDCHGAQIVLKKGD